MIWSSDHLFICQWCWYESHHLLLRWFFSVIFHVRLFYIETSLRLHNSPPHLFCSQFLTIPILALWTFYIHLMNRVKCRDQAIVEVWSLDILTYLNHIFGYEHERTCFKITQTMVCNREGGIDKYFLQKLILSQNWAFLLPEIFWPMRGLVVDLTLPHVQYTKFVRLLRIQK